MISQSLSEFEVYPVPFHRRLLRMPNLRTLDQEIAVFGESGSGKTVLLSSFYGAAQEPEFLNTSDFQLIPESTEQGLILQQIFLGMKNDGEVPQSNKLKAHEYSFKVKLTGKGTGDTQSQGPFDALRLVWHDYPGEWFTQDIENPDIAQRRVDAFRSLLSADVAVLLVDAQRLIDYAGEEERYLKSLFWNFRTGLLNLKEDILEDGQRLTEFPRVWVLALSKADLLPDMNVITFRDLVIGKAGEDLTHLGAAVSEFVDTPEALSLGQDFVLLSSAKFEPEKIVVSKRVGLDLLLPISAILPFERHLKWAQMIKLPANVLQNLLGEGSLVAGIALAFLFKKDLRGPLGLIQKAVTSLIGRQVMIETMNKAQEKIAEINRDASVKHDALSGILARFDRDLKRGEAEKVLFRSPQ